MLAPPSMRTVVPAREAPQISTVGMRVRGGTGSSTGGAKVAGEGFLTAGVPGTGERSVPLRVTITLTVMTPSPGYTR